MQNGTEFVMCWGSSSSGKVVSSANPWSDYTGVWHMNDPGNDVTNVLDSTANHLDGTTVSSSTSKTDGKIGGARFILCNEDERGCSIAEWDKPEQQRRFRDPDELTSGYRIGGRPLGEWTDAIVIEDFIRFPESKPGKGEEAFLIQKQTLELFLERGAISREQYEKSLGELERTGKGDEKRKKTGEPLDKQG